jgi:hypothetical protein
MAPAGFAILVAQAPSARGVVTVVGRLERRLIVSDAEHLDGRRAQLLVLLGSARIMSVTGSGGSLVERSVERACFEG